MKKNLFAFLMMTLVLSASSGICFANENGDSSQTYAEEQALIAEMSKPVVNDQEYPQWGLRAHSWITGTGNETIAHTQLIDMASGTLIKEMAKHCSYIDLTYDYMSNN